MAAEGDGAIRRDASAPGVRDRMRLFGDRYRVVRALSARRVVAEGPSGRVIVEAITAPRDLEAWKAWTRQLAGVGADGLHPLVDHVVDESSEELLVVSPWVDGESLVDVLASQAPLDPDVAVWIVDELARVVAFVHRCSALGTLDADDFVLTEKHGALCAVRGNWHAPHSLQPRAGRYAAPEVTASGSVSTSADVYSLGAIFYELLSGQAIGSTPLQELAPWIDPGLARVVHAMLLPSPSRRFPNLEAVAVALQRFLPQRTLGRSALCRIDAASRMQAAARARMPQSWSDAAHAEPGETGDDPLLGAMVDGRFELERVLGQGGMGAVYLAKSSDGTKCAVKMMRSDAVSPGQHHLRRFIREARAMNAVQSDHVVQVIDAGTDPKLGVPYIAMELLQGRDLAGAITELGPLEPAVASALVIQVCKGLTAAHALGFVHRDIKPSNIFLHEAAGGQIVAKLCDFGIAKHAVGGEESTSELTASGKLLGSPAYMAPEQLANARRVDARADIWSLCVSLYKALSGRTPWDGARGVAQLFVRITSTGPSPLQTMAPWVSTALAEVVHRGLRRDPNERFQTAAELASALAPFAAELTALDRRAVRGVSATTRANAEEHPTFSFQSNTKPEAGVHVAVAETAADAVLPLPELSPTPAKGSRRWPIVAIVAAVALGVGTFATIRLRAPEVRAADTKEVAATPSATAKPSVAAPAPTPAISTQPPAPTTTTPSAPIAPIAKPTVPTAKVPKPIAASATTIAPPPPTATTTAAPTVVPPPPPKDPLEER